MNAWNKANTRKKTLKSRERVLKVINHQETDRVPIDMGMHLSTGISAFAYWNLREHLGLPVEMVDVPDINQFLARVEEDVLKRFHCDCKMLYPKWPDPYAWNPRGKYKFNIPAKANPQLRGDGSWRFTNGEMSSILPANGFFFDDDWLDFFEGIDNFIDANAREAEIIYKETDYFTTYLGPFNGYFHNDDADWLCRMITDPTEIYEESDKISKLELIKAGKVCNKLGKYVQGIALNIDLGTQRGLICRPSLYEDLWAPFIKRFCDFIHQNSDMKVFLHCCGSIKPIIPLFIQSGIDILNPVQIAADDMNPVDLKREFGDRITFWGGGCDTQHVLPMGAIEEIQEHVRNQINIFKHGGGYVFNSVHNIMGDIGPEKIVALYDTAYEESFYE